MTCRKRSREYYQIQQEMPASSNATPRLTTHTCSNQEILNNLQYVPSSQRHGYYMIQEEKPASNDLHNAVDPQIDSTCRRTTCTCYIQKILHNLLNAPVHYPVPNLKSEYSWDTHLCGSFLSKPEIHTLVSKDPMLSQMQLTLQLLLAHTDRTFKLGKDLCHPLFSRQSLFSY